MNFTRLWIASPPPARSIRASANSVTTSARRSRWRPPPTRSARFLERLHQVRAHGLPGRSAAREDPGEHRRKEGEREHGQVQLDVRLRRQGEGRHRRQDHAQEDDREADAQHAPEGGQEQALGEELGEDPPPPRPQGRAQRHLAAPCRAASEEQVGDVGAGDEQHEPDRPQEQPHPGDRLAAQEVVLQRLDARAPPRVRAGVLLGDALGDRLHVRVGLLQGHVGLQAAHHQQPVEVVVDLLGGESEGHVQVVHDPVGGPGSEDPHHGVGLAVQPDLTADDVAVGPEPLLPEAMGQDEDLIPAHLAFLGQEVAAQEEAVPHHRHEPRGRELCSSLVRAIADGQAHVPAGPGVQVLEDRGLALPLEKVAGGARVAVPLDSRPHHDELVGVGIGQGSEQGGVDDAEDRGVGPDPQGKGQRQPPQ